MQNIMCSIMPFQQVITLHSMQRTNRPAPPAVGPSDFCDHRTAELAAKKESMVKHRISHYWPFFGGEKEECFCLRRTFLGGHLICGTIHVPFHKHSCLPPNNANMSKRPANKAEVSKVEKKKNYETCYLPKKYRTELFFLTSSVLLVTRSLLST